MTMRTTDSRTEGNQQLQEQGVHHAESTEGGMDEGKNLQRRRWLQRLLKPEVFVLKVLLLVFAAQPLAAQQNVEVLSTAHGEVRVERTGDGAVSMMHGPLGSLMDYHADGAKEGTALQRNQTATAALGIFERYSRTFRLQKPSEELKPVRNIVDDLGFRHIRFAQTYRGVPVWGSDLDVHVDRNGTVYAVEAYYHPTPVGIETEPTLSETDAVKAAEQDLQGKGIATSVSAETAAALGIEKPTAHLVLYPDPTARLHPAYQVDMHAGPFQVYRYMIDARSGAVLAVTARHCSIDHTTHLPGPTASCGMHLPEKSAGAAPASGGTGFFDAEGTDLNGRTRRFRTYRHNDGAHYAVWDLANYDHARSNPPYELVGGAITYTAGYSALGESMLLGPVRSTGNRFQDATAVSAHANVKVTYDYYRNTFGRRSIDDNDGRIISIVHVAAEDGMPMDNALWIPGSRGRMIYGDGNEVFKPLAGGLDIAAHEMTHGVIEHSADLVYEGESGALNESFADVFALFIDRDDFQIGEDIMLPGQGTALRDLSDPANPLVRSRQPDHMFYYQDLPNDAEHDNGGVHINSGIPNKAAYLVISALGHEKTEQIYYRALTVYLKQRSTFLDCRRAVIAAAYDLYGEYEASVAAAAFDAVGIYDARGSVSSAAVSAETGTSEQISGRITGPNPFSTTTTFNVELTAPADLSILLFDHLGNSVGVVADERATAGTHSYTIDAAELPAGTYLLRLRIDGRLHTEKLTVLK